MKLVVRLVYIVSLTVVLFQKNGSSFHIEALKNTYNNDGDLHDNVLPIEHEHETLKNEDVEYLNLEDSNIEILNEVSSKELEKEEGAISYSSNNKNRVARQVNGNLYPQLGTPHYSNNQYYPTPGQGITPNNTTWHPNSHYNNPIPYNPLANMTFNQYPSDFPYNNSGSPYNNPSSTYHPPQGQTYNQYNNSRPGQQYSYGSSTPRNPTYPKNPYPSNNHFNASSNSSSHYGSSGYLYGTHYTGYPTPPTFNAASPRPGYPYQQNNSTQWQGNSNRNNTYGYNIYNGSRPGQHSSYQNTSPRYPQGQYPSNTNNYNPMYPSPPPYQTPNHRPVTHHGQNNSSHYPQWNSNSYVNYSRPQIVNVNNSNPGNNNYNSHNYPNSNPNLNNNPGYPTPPTYANGGLRPTNGAYPTTQNNGQGTNTWNPAQPYNPNNPYENPNLFNYPFKNSTNPYSMYDPRRNPPHNFSY